MAGRRAPLPKNKPGDSKPKQPLAPDQPTFQNQFANFMSLTATPAPNRIELERVRDLLETKIIVKTRSGMAIQRPTSSRRLI